MINEVNFELRPLDVLIRDSVLTEISGLDLTLINDYAHKNKTKLNNLYESGILDPELLNNALETAIYKQAKREVGSGLNPADHFSRPDCLSYSLLRGIFTKEELSKIRFEHPDTMKNFSGKYSRNIFEKLTEELLNPKPKINIGWEHCDICTC